jgi:hypothetical protein
MKSRKVVKSETRYTFVIIFCTNGHSTFGLSDFPTFTLLLTFAS